MYRISSTVKYSHGLAKSLKPLYSEQQNMLLGAVSEFAAAELAPYASNVDESGEFPFTQLAGLAELGVTGLTLDEAYGGAGGGYRDMIHYAELELTGTPTPQRVQLPSTAPTTTPTPTPTPTSTPTPEQRQTPTKYHNQKRPPALAGGPSL